MSEETRGLWLLGIFHFHCYGNVGFYVGVFKVVWCCYFISPEKMWNPWKNRTKCWKDSEKPGDPQLAASWQIFSLGCNRSLQYFATAWLWFSIHCIFFLCRVMPVKGNGSFFSVSSQTTSSQNQPDNGQRESSWSRCVVNKIFDIAAFKKFVCSQSWRAWI